MTMQKTVKATRKGKVAIPTEIRKKARQVIFQSVEMKAPF
jgi:bifunctional DNA-binding transcriptional regulator/antitoxin component of YhaV-PrlF toxin-antitoxin module